MAEPADLPVSVPGLLCAVISPFSLLRVVVRIAGAKGVSESGHGVERKAHPRGGGSRSSKIQGSGDSRPEWLGGNQSPEHLELVQLCWVPPCMLRV